MEKLFVKGLFWLIEMFSISYWDMSYTIYNCQKKNNLQVGNILIKTWNSEEDGHIWLNEIYILVVKNISSTYLNKWNIQHFSGQKYPIKRQLKTMICKNHLKW